MIKFFILLGVTAVSLSLAACTLTPSPSGGYDILDTEYKAEAQDPVAVPVKEASDRPWIKLSPKPAPAPVFSKPEAPPGKTEVKKQDKLDVKPVLVKPSANPSTVSSVPGLPIKKTEEKSPEIKKPAPPPSAKKPVLPSLPCDHAKASNVATPPPPPAGVKGPQAIAAPKRETLQSGDRLKITVFREKDLTGEYQVNDKGMISFPMIGEIKAAGEKPSALQKNLTDALSKGYLVKPDINVEWLSDCNSK